MKKISIIVPCFNEEVSLPIFYDAISSILSKINYDYELLFVNDGSKDKTLIIVKELSKKDSHVKYISFSRNFGKESAMYAGFCNAVGDYIAIMDADMQDPPLLIPEMLEILENGEYDCVATRRVTRKGEPPIRSWFARKFYKIINNISSTTIIDGARDFRLMKRKMVDAIIKMDECNRFSKGLFGWVGFKTYWISYENVERVAGETKWNFFSLFRYAVDGIISFSQVPLHIAIWVGAFVSFASLTGLIITAIYNICNTSAQILSVWVLMISALLLGITIFSIGTASLYIEKIFLETKRRPHYIVDETNMKE